VTLPVMCGFCYPDLDYDSYVHEACKPHAPDLSGPDDDSAKRRFGTEFITHTGEAGGTANQAMCEDIHHRQRD